MKTSRKYLSLCGLVVIAVLAMAKEAHAYIDLGTGSYVIQLVIASFFGMILGIKTFWGRIVRLFSRGKSKNDLGE